MSALIIDRYSDALAWDAIVPLEGVEYLLSFFWSDRESRWYLSIYNQDNDPLALWMCLNVGAFPLRRFRAQANIPPGAFVVIDTSGEDAETSAPEDFGSRVLLAYITSDDERIAGRSIVGVM
jgi:hypothetical protein